MILGGSQIGMKTLGLGSGTVRKSLNALSGLSNAIDGVKRVVGLNEEEFYVNDGSESVDYLMNSLKSEDVGRIFGRLKGRVRLIQSFDGNGRSMGTLRLVSEESTPFNCLNYRIKWRWKMGDGILVDIPKVESEIQHQLTADDIGTTILVEIAPKEESEDTMNVTYCEVGPIEMDNSTKTALSKSLKMGQVRFPIRILEEDIEDEKEQEQGQCMKGGLAKNMEHSLGEYKKMVYENSCVTKDILVVSNDDVRVIRNGMSSLSSNLDKRVEWSARYFGGNISVDLDGSSTQELVLCSGYDIRRQKIRIQTTSRSARDMAALIIRCFNSRHSVSIEAIIEKGVSWVSGDLRKEMSGDPETRENSRLNIFAYIARLEEEIGSLWKLKTRLSEDKKLLQVEKAILENEIAETISAYQEIISQYQQERASDGGNSQLIREFNIEKISKISTEPKNLDEKARIGRGPENTVYKKNSSLVHGFSGAAHESYARAPSPSADQNNSGIKAILEENASLKLINKELTEKLNEEKSANMHARKGAQEIKAMQMEMAKLRAQLEESRGEIDEKLRIIEGLRKDLRRCDEEQEKLRLGEALVTVESVKVQELQNQIIELQGSNSEKQQAVRTLSTEKSRLSREVLLLKRDSEKLRLANNEMNKRLVSLNLRSCKNIVKLEVSKESFVSILPLDQNLPTADAISRLRKEQEELESANAHLTATIVTLKSRIRKLAMINSF